MKRSILLFLLASLMVACVDTELVPAEETPYNNAVEVPSSDSVYSYSKDVTIEEARNILEDFLKDNSLSLSKSGSSSIGMKKISEGFAINFGKKTLSKSTGDSTEAKVYVFNFEDEGGFALMSATRETPPIFAITDGGTLDTTKEIDNPGLAMFMATLETKILRGEMKSEDLSSSLSKASADKEWSVYNRLSGKDKFYKLSSGLCPYWHQDHPFNQKCPEGPIPKRSSRVNGKTLRLDSVGHYPAGCVPVACALLMSTYRYPQMHNGIRFNWEAMINRNDYEGVALLLSELGRSENLNTTYSADSSGSSSNNVPRTLRNFGYSNGGQNKSFSVYNINQELKKGYPVLISGACFCTDYVAPWGIPLWEYSGGHQWIGQGLMEVTYKIDHFIGEGPYTQYLGATTETISYILCNMGWGYGNGNGYYLSEIFDTNNGPVYLENGYSKIAITSGTSGVYKYNFMAVTGIRK